MIMRLLLNDIKQIAHGVARVESLGESIGLFRFTKEQEELYRDQSYPSMYKRTFATAGITLEFDTDSEYLSLSVEVSVGCGFRWFTHSIFANEQRIGEISGFVPEEETTTAAGKFCLGQGMKRVRIVFPWNECSRIIALELDDGAKVIPIPKKRKVLIFGDSITQGYTTWLPENSYASRIARWLDADAINKGIGGESYWPALAQLPDTIQPDMICGAYGANDWNSKTETEFAENAEMFCRALRENYPNAKIIALTPIWSKTREEKQKDRWPFENMVQHLSALQEKIENLTVIPGTEFVPLDTACFAEDHVHPNDIGFAHYAQNLQNKLTNIID
jgi:lysophospholipase L1-like esterase